MIKVVNEDGIEEIRSFLMRRYIYRNDISWVINSLDAWAEMAERQMDIGNPPVIELKVWESLSGCVEEFQISDAGITTIHEEID